MRQNVISYAETGAASRTKTELVENSPAATAASGTAVLSAEC